MNNQLVKKEKEYPFTFFPEEAFNKEQVVSLIVSSYEMEITAGLSVVQPHLLSLKDAYAVTLGKIGRIVHLNEEHEDLFFDVKLNEFIRDLAIEFNYDLPKVLVEFIKRTSVGINVSSDVTSEFEKDIKKVFDIERMFYLDTRVPYDTIRYFKNDKEPDPFNEKVINKLFRNMPVVSVW